MTDIINKWKIANMKNIVDKEETHTINVVASVINWVLSFDDCNENKNHISKSSALL